jgi:hypothetical protein
MYYSTGERQYDEAWYYMKECSVRKWETAWSVRRFAIEEEGEE